MAAADEAEPQFPWRRELPPEPSTSRITAECVAAAREVIQVWSPSRVYRRLAPNSPRRRSTSRKLYVGATS